MIGDEVKVAPSESGFELGGRFYPWRISDHAKDLLIVDRFTAIPVTAFFEIVADDEHPDRGRAPIILAMIATSVRAGNPEWSVERVVQAVLDTPLSEIPMIETDDPETPEAEADAAEVGGDVVPLTDAAAGGAST